MFSPNVINGVLQSQFDEITTHLNHQLSFSPFSNKGHILVDDNFYDFEVNNEGHMYSPQQLEGYDFYGGKSYLGHYNDMNFSPGGNTFRIYTTGIANWSPSESLIPAWIEGFYGNIIRKIPPRYTRIEIYHYAYLIDMHGNIKSQEEYSLQFRDLVESDKRVPRVQSSNVIVEPFVHTNFTNLSNDCLIVDMAHLYNHPKGSEGIVTLNNSYSEEPPSEETIKMNVLRFGYAEVGIYNYIASQCNLFKVNDDGSVTTFIDIMRQTGIDFRIDEPIEIITDIITNCNTLFSKVLEELSGLKFWELNNTGILQKVKDDKSNICSLFDMLFDGIPLNNIKFLYLKILLQENFDSYQTIIKGVGMDKVIETLHDVLNKNNIVLDESVQLVI